VSTKLDLLGNLSGIADTIVIGGGMANTFLAALGYPVGKSLCEHDLLQTAKDIISAAQVKSCALILPVDAVVAKEFKAGAPSRTVAVSEVGQDDMILDIGQKSTDAVIKVFDRASTVVWNGPLGAFEIAPFDAATVSAAKHAAALTRSGKLVTVAGGGDTVAALNHAGVAQDFTYVSTAGGAFLEWLEGKPLPGVKALEENR
jgi:phosphoglycerate kinase